ncbi:hypothetical protein [Saccharothrix algeriensis]|uniref:Secreted protein n=1 Tax=Saccharothrix algeriensis TaxID=173560 RepID=A0A8T8I5U6_9PSEU|nr:hypothetical protein [Saccharothrix algeriensis]MBM7812134.1 hypothetical protein [Saccharothrix algeriensis]QTR05790.1 hypothetical protein J7S33_15455 [Saccharothrix algeriensis]
MTRRPAPTRLARAALLAVTSAALSVAAHGAAGGDPTEFAPALPLTALTALVGTALADRGRSPWAILAVLGAAQVGQHALLSLGDHVADGPGLGFSPVAMTAAHVVAALLTGLLLARADSALTVVSTAVSTAVSRLVPVLCAFVPTAHATPPPTAPPGPDAPTAVLLRRVNGRRGPPPVLIT